MSERPELDRDATEADIREAVTAWVDANVPDAWRAAAPDAQRQRERPFQGPTVGWMVPVQADPADDLVPSEERSVNKTNPSSLPERIP